MIYVGCHKMKKKWKFDKYSGSGVALKIDKEKYGIDKFTMRILFEFDNADDAIAKEAEIVDVEFVKRNDTYNKRPGGVGYFLHTEETKLKCGRGYTSLKGERNGMYGNGHLVSGERNGNYGVKHTDEWRENHSIMMKNKPPFSEEHIKNLKISRAKYKGDYVKNRKWMNNGGITKMIKPDEIEDYISNGWILGRKIEI